MSRQLCSSMTKTVSRKFTQFLHVCDVSHVCSCAVTLTRLFDCTASWLFTRFRVSFMAGSRTGIMDNIYTAHLLLQPNHTYARRGAPRQYAAMRAYKSTTPCGRVAAGARAAQRRNNGPELDQRKSNSKQLGATTSSASLR